MHDPTLLLSSYLIVKESDKIELRNSLSNALDVAEKKEEKLSTLIKICRSESSSLEKITKLQSLSMIEADFFIKFFISKLSKEEKISRILGVDDRFFAFWCSTKTRISS